MELMYSMSYMGHIHVYTGFSSVGYRQQAAKSPHVVNLHVHVCVSSAAVLTLANMVFPVPGGPYISTLRYMPPFLRVLIVERASARILLSN